MMNKKISAEDAKLFQDNMSDVEPIKYKSRVEMIQQIAPLVLTEPLHPLAYIQKVVSGISPKQIRAIKQGKKIPEKMIDLHHHTQAQALQVLDALVANYHDQERFILIVHGTNASRGLAVLKSLVYQYFKDHPARLIMISAHVSHGGLGATYIWLKKRT